jgi:hypothetical protein
MNVFFTGDLCNPSTVKFFDASTGKEIKPLSGNIYLTLGNTKTTVQFVTTSGTVYADLVPPLPDPRTFFTLSCDVSDDMQMQRFLLRFHLRRFDRIGSEMVEDQARRLHLRHVVSHKLLSAARYPAQVYEQAFKSCGRATGEVLGGELFAKTFSPTPNPNPNPTPNPNPNPYPIVNPTHAPRASAPVSVKPPPVAQPAIRLPKPTAAASCDECAGTGTWVNPISGKQHPCSRGCRP